MGKEIVNREETIGELAERVMFKGVPDDQKKVAFAICQRYGLDPILKHVVIIGGNAYITRDGLLQVAHDSGIPFSITFGEPTERQNPYSGEKDIYLSATLHRQNHPDFSAGLWFGEYATGKGAWKTHPAAMHQKVVEVYLLRRGFNVSMTPVDEMSFTPESEIIEATVTEMPPQEPQPRSEPSAETPETKPTSDGNGLQMSVVTTSTEFWSWVFGDLLLHADIKKDELTKIANAAFGAADDDYTEAAILLYDRFK